jgi:hypothetical protein
MIQPSLLDAPTADRRRRPPRPRPLPPSCALCPAPPASPLGLCRDCLSAAATEHARLTPQAPEPDDRRPASVPFAQLCPRCGRPGHDVRRCDT